MGHGIGSANSISMGTDGQILWDQTQNFSLTGTAPAIEALANSPPPVPWNLYSQESQLSFLGAPATFTIGGIGYSLTGVSLTLNSSWSLEDKLNCQDDNNLGVACYAKGGDNSSIDAYIFNYGEGSGSPEAFTDMTWSAEAYSSGWEIPIPYYPYDHEYNFNGTLNDWLAPPLSLNATLNYDPWLSYFLSNDPVVLTLDKITSLDLLDYDSRDTDDYVQQESSSWSGTADLTYVFTPSSPSGTGTTPEPGTLLLIGTGLIGFGACLSRKRKNRAKQDERRAFHRF